MATRWIALLFMAAACCGTACAQINACDVALPYGSVDVVDVQRTINMAIVILPCTASINGVGVCNAVTVQRVVNSALGLSDCILSDGSHEVALTWTDSSSDDGGVTCCQYSIYRSTTSGGPYVDPLNSSPVARVNYLDQDVSAGDTWFYVVRAELMDNSAQSRNSSEIGVTIPLTYDFSAARGLSRLCAP